MCEMELGMLETISNIPEITNVNTIAQKDQKA